MQPFAPLFVDLQEKDCLIAGGGVVACRKAKLLLDYGASVTLVSPRLHEDLLALLAADRITYLQDIYRPAYLRRRFLVVCATNDPAVNRAAALDCHERGILVNTVSDPRYCSFFLPARLQRGLLTVAVSTAGASPALSRRIRDEVGECLSDELVHLLQYLADLRPRILEQLPPGRERRALLQYLAGDEFHQVFKAGPPAHVNRLVEEKIALAAGQQDAPPSGQ